ncbi:hypothetical protein ABUW04_37605 [Streptacidiphilus sp. N1-10]|uniref:Uncharacterized protein n=1 Tax=Streptacidiphilus jeojiensis TaxID=3229225 RepID=A0ABV6Y0D7_9ACTN
MTRRRTVLWSVVGVLLLAGAGAVTAVALHGSGPSLPATVLDMPAFPAPGATAPIAFPAVEVALRPGQSFGVRYTVPDYPERWSPGTAEDAAVVQQGDSITVRTPPKGTVGGSSTYVQVYRAVEPGTTHIVWNLACGTQVSACRYTETFDVTVSA